MTTATVVTGLGVIAPNGLGTEDYWKATLAGESGIGPVTRFDASQYPARLAGEVAGFVAEDHIPSRLMPQTDHMTRLALAAADWALADAGLDTSRHCPSTAWAWSPPRPAAASSSASASCRTCGARAGVRQRLPVLRLVLRRQHRPDLHPAQAARPQRRPAHRTGRRHRRPRPGPPPRPQGLPAVVSGGVDAAICPWGWVAQLASGLMSTGRRPGPRLPALLRRGGRIRARRGRRDPASSRTRTSARDRAAPPRSTARSPDTPPPSTPRRAPAGRPACAGPPRRPRRRGARPRRTSTSSSPTRPGSRTSTGPRPRRSPRLFGPHGVPVTAPKTMTGRLLAGGAALDVATALLALRDGVIPPTANVAAGRRRLRDRPGHRGSAGRRTCARAWCSRGATAASTRRSSYAAPHDPPRRDHHRVTTTV